jgi:ribonuclease HI
LALSNMCTVKSFPTRAEAEAFIQGTSATPATASSASSASKTGKFYAVAIGHVPGVYTDYASVLAQTKNCPGAKQASFATHDEAQAFVNDYKRDASIPISLRGDLSEASSLLASKSDHPAKKVKKSNAAPALAKGDVEWAPGTGFLEEGAEDGFDTRIKLDVETGNIRYKTSDERGGTKLQPTGDFSGPIHVYTDGSSLGNGRVGAVGGVGVYFGPNDARCVSAQM